MHWRGMINDFNGLVAEYVRRSSKNKAADALAHDKKTIKGWLQGAVPSDPSDVAWVISRALKNGIDLSAFQTFSPIYDFSSMVSYETKIQTEPPDLSWLTNIQPPPVIKTDFCGLDLDGPLGVSSSPLLGDDKWTALILNLGFGLSTFKTRRTGPRQSWNPPQIAFVVEPPDLINYDPASPPEVLVSFDRGDVEGPIPNLVNSIGVPSENTAAQWQEIYERIKRHPRGRFVGVSVMGDGETQRELVRDFELAVNKAKDVRPPFVELNLSCPNLETGRDVCDDPSLVRLICTKARKILSDTGILLFIKLPYLPPVRMYDLLKAAGPLVDAVSFRNTYRVRPIARHRSGKTYPAFTGREFGGLSGPCTFEMTLRGVSELVGIRLSLGQEFRIIAVGGVSTAGQVADLLNAGADLVQACTATMFDPLLAWKIRFHMKQFEARISSEQALPLLWPRDQIEVDSWKNAFEAAGELQRRHPERAVPYETFRHKWNDWMEQRPATPIGSAHRISPRTFAQWLRDFTS